MTIVFFCTSLHSGHDGVGDYTRRLAAECIARGHTCTIVALNDSQVDSVSDGREGELRLIRWSAKQPWSHRLAGAIADLRRSAPDWVSWQFVAYGYHPRGFLPGALLEHAGRLRGPRCHVMLHELWLGLEQGASLRHRSLGWLQRRGVVCLLDQLAPDVLHTSNATYREVVRREGYDAQQLALFGNVPVAESAPRDGSPFAPWLLASAATSPLPSLLGVAFGTLHPQWRPEPTIRWWLETARRHHRAPTLVALGRSGRHTKDLLGCLQRAGVTAIATGELDPTTISRLLGAADFGLAPHPWALIGKSGAAAAMLDHGLPVLVPRDDWRLRGPPPPYEHSPHPLLARLADLDDAATDRWLTSRRAASPALPAVATSFLLALDASTERP